MKKTKLFSIIFHSATFASLLLFSTNAIAQAKKKVLFLGNSYTAYNNLPQLVADVALSAGDTVVFSSNTPGGYTLQGHSTNATSLSLLAAGDLDHVVLQEQSQLPSFPQGQVATSCFPFARALDSIAQSLNPCVKSVFYMTWGRKNGDASNCATWPPVCTYSGMDSLLRLRYMQMAVDNDAMVSPVGAIWRYIRSTYPSIELYQTDESHPSLAGSYAAACAFYTVFFRKSPNLIATNAGLDPLVASQIRQASHLVAFDSLATWLVDAYDANAAFIFSSNGLTATFQNNSNFAVDYNWDFGDGSTSTQVTPTHVYANPGTYQVALQSNNCFSSDTYTQMISILNTGLPEGSSSVVVYPNPVSDELNVVGMNGNEVTIRFLDGRVAMVSPMIGSKVNVQGLPSGAYVLQVPVGGYIHSFRFFKLK
ncbi:MAG: PKD domain-containing protein [Bacteroidota bacterium]